MRERPSVLLEGEPLNGLSERHPHRLGDLGLEADREGPERRVEDTARALFNAAERPVSEDAAGGEAGVSHELSFLLIMKVTFNFTYN
jgi:hypothetical protein